MAAISTAQLSRAINVNQPIGRYEVYKRDYPLRLFKSVSMHSVKRLVSLSDFVEGGSQDSGDELMRVYMPIGEA